jgi:hypothetical protein
LSEPPSDATPVTAGDAPAIIGCPTAIGFAIQISEVSLDHIEWIGPARLAVWTTRPDGDLAEYGIWVVDVIRRKSTPILGRLRGMSITAVVFSENKMFCSVIVNRFIVTFVKIQKDVANTRRIGSFTFEPAVCVAFHTQSDRAIIVTETGEISKSTPLSARNRKLRFNGAGHIDLTDRGKVTAACVRRDSLFVGTSSGALLCLEIGTFQVLEVRSMKSGVVSINSGWRSSMLAIDESGQSLFCADNGQFFPIHTAIKNAVMYSPMGFLARLPGDGRIRTMNPTGQAKVFPPACIQRCFAMKPRNKWGETLSQSIQTPGVCLLAGIPLAARLMQLKANPKLIEEETIGLRNLCAHSKDLLPRTIRYSLILKDYDSARALLSSVDPSSPVFVINLLKAALIGTRDGDASIEASATTLIANGYHDDVVDLLLLRGNWRWAADELVEHRKFGDAALVCAMQENSEMKREYVKRFYAAIASSIPAMRGYALGLLAQVGDLAFIAAEFARAGETEQADFLSRTPRK